MCRLVKALYGHPESGGQWENHLKAIKAVGGHPITNHPSLFWFPRGLWTVYVDDLLLACPEGCHADV